MPPPIQLPGRDDPRSATSAPARSGAGGGSGSASGADFSPLGGSAYAPKRKDNLFLWTVFILLLVGLVMACWIGSYYVYVHPEKPRNYRILSKLKKLLPPQRFSINAAPTGEFLTAEKLHAKLVAMTPPEFRDHNNDLLRAFLRNYPPGRLTIPYLTGRFNVIESYTLGPTDLASSGVVALAASEDSPKVLIEHLFTAPVNAVPLIKRNLPVGKDLELPRTYYLTAVIHAEKLTDGRLLLTVVPLNYGSYGIKGSPSAFSLEPPLTLNLGGGLPIIKDAPREEAMRAYLAYRQKNGLSPLFGSRRPRPGGGGAENNNAPPSAPLTGTDKPPPPENDTAIERAPPTENVAAATPTPAGRPGTRGNRATPAPTVVAVAPTPTPAAPSSIPADPLAQQRVARAMPVGSPSPGASPTSGARPTPAAPTPQPAAVVASNSPTPARPAASVAAASPQPSASPRVVSGGNGRGGWTVYAPGRAPAGRQVKINEIAALSDNTSQTTGGQPLYLGGRFSVSVVMNNPDTGEGSAVLYPVGDRSVRILARYPPGRSLPAEGAQVERDEQRPYQITDVRRGADGLLNVWVREITSE